MKQDDEQKEEIIRDIEVPYHAYMPGEVASTLRPLLNDYRYAKTCEICNVVPNSEIYDSY